MSVRFEEIVFHNNNNIPVTLTVEAPIGTVASGPLTVRANCSVTVQPERENCASCLIIASDSAHDIWKQSFGMAAPASGLRSYLEAIDVQYVIASFHGSVKARTE